MPDHDLIGDIRENDIQSSFDDDDNVSQFTTKYLKTVTIDNDIVTKYKKILTKPTQFVINLKLLHLLQQSLQMRLHLHLQL